MASIIVVVIIFVLLALAILFICQNGHQINRFLNGSRNLACKCQQSFQKRSGSKS